MADFVVFRDAANSWRWKLVASNGQRIATSGESFASKQNAINAAELVRSYAGNARILVQD